MRFYIPPEACWEAICQQRAWLGEHLTGAPHQRGPGSGAAEPQTPGRLLMWLSSTINVAEFNATAVGYRIHPDVIFRDLSSQRYSGAHRGDQVGYAAGGHRRGTGANPALPSRGAEVRAWARRIGVEPAENIRPMRRK
ncbi:MAG: hypothetical protein ACUVRV_11080 [Cyanobacteriota bacterium]